MTGVWSVTSSRCPQNGYDLKGEMGWGKPLTSRDQMGSRRRIDGTVQDQFLPGARHKANN
jgi:hypothetical protein